MKLLKQGIGCLVFPEVALGLQVMGSLFCPAQIFFVTQISEVSLIHKYFLVGNYILHGLVASLVASFQLIILRSPMEFST